MQVNQSTLIGSLRTRMNHWEKREELLPWALKRATCATCRHENTSICAGQRNECAREVVYMGCRHAVQDENKNRQRLRVDECLERAEALWLG